MIYNTQCERVLNWLETRGELTVRQAVTELNIMSLPVRIMELRNDGYNIELVHKRSRNGKRYGAYLLREV